MTAHYEASLAYMDDLLSVVDEFGWSWCLYDYKGPFGLVKGTNNALIRPDAVYEKMGTVKWIKASIKWSKHTFNS